METTGTDGSWKEQKRKLKERFSILTDGDLEYIPGKSNEMFEKMRTRLGKTKDEMIIILSTLH